MLSFYQWEAIGKFYTEDRWTDVHFKVTSVSIVWKQGAERAWR